MNRTGYVRKTVLVLRNYELTPLRSALKHTSTLLKRGIYHYDRATRRIRRYMRTNRPFENSPSLFYTIFDETFKRNYAIYDILLFTLSCRVLFHCPSVRIFHPNVVTYRTT